MALSSPFVATPRSFPPGPAEGLYPISVVTELTGVSAHTLRGYERAGLLHPARTDGGVRRYSADDLTVVRRAATLGGEGVSLAGIRRILALEAELAALRAQLDALRAAPTAEENTTRR